MAKILAHYGQGKNIITHKRFFTLLIAIFACVLCIWIADAVAHRYTLKTIRDLAPKALCTVELMEGSESASGSFTTLQAIEGFHVRVCPEARRERLLLSFDGGNIFNYNGTIAKPDEFGIKRMIPPGTYTVTLGQVMGKHGGIVVILDKAVQAKPSTGMTGWQIISRIHLVLLLISGIWALANHKSSNRRRRTSSNLVFHYIFLSFFLIFFYLLCHEGGHALAEISFGHFEFSESDFWGIQGGPHSGGKGGPDLEPWQHKLITGGAVIVPTLVAWVLFVLWWLWLRRKRNQIIRLYASATIAYLIIPLILLLGCLLGIVNASHEEAFIACMPGPQWLGIAISWCVLLVCVFMLWYIVPEIMRILKAQYLELQRLKETENETERTTPSTRI